MKFTVIVHNNQGASDQWDVATIEEARASVAARYSDPHNLKITIVDQESERTIVESAPVVSDE